MATSVERLLQLKKEIEQAKMDKARAEGALKQNMDRLKREFNVTTLKAAETKLADLLKRSEEVDAEIEKAVKKLEEQYQWG